MGILIGMEMPKEMRTLTIFPNGYVAVYDAFDTFIGETKAIQIPPHGRVIDADRFDVFTYDDNIVEQYGNTFDSGVEYVLNQIDLASTVIPADKEDDDEET